MSIPTANDVSVSSNVEFLLFLHCSFRRFLFARAQKKSTSKSINHYLSSFVTHTLILLNEMYMTTFGAATSKKLYKASSKSMSVKNITKSEKLKKNVLCPREHFVCIRISLKIDTAGSKYELSRNCGELGRIWWFFCGKFWGTEEMSAELLSELNYLSYFIILWNIKFLIKKYD